MGRVVVGVDGSECSRVALEWAAEEAEVRGVPLQAVCAYHVPAGWFGIGDGMVVTDPVAVDDLEAYAKETLERSLADVLGSEGSLGVEVDLRAVMGRPGDVLVDASDDADLLVVGSRGHGDIGSVLLGSVGMHCVHHARCPVVVVRQRPPS